MPAHPVHEALPCCLIVCKPVTDESVSANDLEDELKDHLHPLKVGRVSPADLNEARQPGGSAAGEVLVLGLKKRLEQQPENDQAWNNLGSALLHMGKYSDAIEAFDRAVEIDESSYVDDGAIPVAKPALLIGSPMCTHFCSFRHTNDQKRSA